MLEGLLTVIRDDANTFVYCKQRDYADDLLALIHSHLSYSITLWGKSSSVHRVFASQKAGVRIIDSAKSHAHCF